MNLMDCTLVGLILQITVTSSAPIQPQYSPNTAWFVLRCTGEPAGRVCKYTYAYTYTYTLHTYMHIHMHITYIRMHITTYIRTHTYAYTLLHTYA